MGSWKDGAKRSVQILCPFDKKPIDGFKHIVTPGLEVVLPLHWFIYFPLSNTISLTQRDSVITQNNWKTEII